MRAALITTTINIPHVLRLYRAYGPDVRFFVAGDEKTHPGAQDFCAALPDCAYYTPHQQNNLGYNCSTLLGFSNDSRRNIALLEALRWGAEIIISVDDDMVATSADFFYQIQEVLREPFNGLQLGTQQEWCDVGMLTRPPVRQRGLPLNMVRSKKPKVSFVTGASIGIVQGAIVGTADTDANTYFQGSPTEVQSIGDVLRAGFVAHPDARFVFNSQFTAFRRELAPAFAQFYLHQQRNTDILASLVMRRVARERGLHTYYGPPIGYHERNPHLHHADQLAEAFGLQHVEPLQEWLEQLAFDPNTSGTQSGMHTVVGMLRNIYQNAPGGVFPVETAMAWLEDVEGVL